MKRLLNVFGSSALCAAVLWPAGVVAQPAVTAVIVWRCPPGLVPPCLVPNSKTLSGDGNGIRPVTRFHVLDAHVDVERTTTRNARVRVRLTVENDSPREFRDVIVPLMAEFDSPDSHGYRFAMFDLKLTGAIPAGKREDVQAMVDIAGRPVGVWLRFPTTMPAFPKK